MMDVAGHVRALFRFSGRERRTTFWLWALIVYGVQGAIGMIAMAPFQSRFQAWADAHPDYGEIRGAPIAFPVELFPVDLVVVLSSVSIVVAILLLAAAIVRRLHDSGLSGWWGLLPLPSQIVGFFLLRPFFADLARLLRPGGQLFWPRSLSWVLLNSAVGLATMAVLIVLLARATQPFDNRFGPMPGEKVD